MALRIKDGRDKFYSFDTNRILILEDDDGSVSHVDFETDGNKSISKAVNTYEDGTRYVEVPNDFFDGTYSRIVAYYVSIDDSGQYTQNKQTFRVTYRQEYEGYTIDDEDDRITIANAIKLTDDAKREAEGHAETARKWAVGAGAVEGTLFSAKHYAGEADAILSTIIDIKIALETYVGSNVEGEESGVYLEIAQKLSNAIEAIRNAMEDEDNGALAQISARAKQILDDLDERLGTSADLTDATILGSINKARGTALEDIGDAVGSDSKYGSALYKIAFALSGALGDISEASSTFGTQSSQASEALEIAKQNALTSINGQVESAINTKLPAKVDFYVGTPDDSPETNTVMGAINKKMEDIDEKATEYLQDLSDAKDAVYTEFGDSLGQLTSHLTDLSNDTYRKAEVDSKVAEATPSDYDSLKNKVTNLEYENRITKAVLAKKIAEETEATGSVIPFPSTGEDGYPLAEWGLLKGVESKSVVWNQMVNFATMPLMTVHGHRFTRESDGVIVSGTSSTYAYNEQGLRLDPTHVYFISCSDYKFNGIDEPYFIYYKKSDGGSLVAVSQDIEKVGITDISVRFSATTFNNKKFTLNVIDMTQLFRVTSESAVTEQMKAFVRAYATAHPEYTAGTLLDSVYESGVSVGANLFNARMTETKTSGGVTVTPSGDTFTISGSAGGVYPLINYDFDEPIFKKGMTISGSILVSSSSTSSFIGIRLRNKTDNSLITFPFAGKTLSFDVDRVQFYTNNTFSGTETIKNIMVNEGSEAREYTPYMSHTIDLSFLNSVEDIGIEGTEVDFEKETVEWKYKSVVLNGNNDAQKMGSTSFWNDTYGQTNGYGIRIFSIEGCDNMNNVYPISSFGDTFNNRFSAIEKEGVGCNGSGNTVFIAVNASRLSATTTNGLNTWLASNPIELVYEISTPIVKSFSELGIVIPPSWDGGKPWIRVEAGGTFTVVSSGAPAEATVSFLTNLGGN